MADNLDITTGAGTAIKTDQLGDGSHVQFVKIMNGSADSSQIIGASGAALLVSPVGTADINVVNITTGTVTALPSGTQIVSVVSPFGTVTNVLTVGTLLGTVAISGTVDGTFGSRQYVVGTTGVATGTGNLVLGFNVNTAVPMKMTSDGTVFVTNTGVQNVNFHKILGEDPLVGEGITGTGVQRVTIANNGSGRLQMVATVGTVGTVLAVSTISGVVVVTASGVTIASGTVTSIPSNTGTLSNVLTVGTLLGTVLMSQSGTGNVTIAGTPTITGSVTALGTPFPIFYTHHASNWNSCIISTTSGGGHAILKTSGAHTLYVTDLMVSVDVPMMVAFYSSSAAQAPKAVVYLATKGGFAFALKTPIILTSAQSLVFIGNASGSCAGFAAGYTVT